MTTTPTPAQRLDALCWSLDERVRRDVHRDWTEALHPLLDLARIVRDLHRDAARPQERPEPAPEGDGTTGPGSGAQGGAQRFTKGERVWIVSGRGAGLSGRVRVAHAADDLVLVQLPNEGRLWLDKRACRTDPEEPAEPETGAQRDGSHRPGHAFTPAVEPPPLAPGHARITMHDTTVDWPQASGMRIQTIGSDYLRFVADERPTPEPGAQRFKVGDRGRVQPTPDWCRRTVMRWLDTPGHPDDKPARGELQWLLNRAEAGRPDLDDDHAFRPVRSVPDDDPAPTAPPVEPDDEPTPAGVTVPPDASPTDSRFDAVGWQYGVRYHDGSVTAEWNGTTQRQHAVDLARLFPDAVVVRRRLNAEWQPAPANLTEVEPTPGPVDLPTTPGGVAWTRDGGRYVLTGDTDSQPWFGPGRYVSADELLALGVVETVA